MPVHAAAPVPPSPPETTMWSDLAFATPAAQELWLWYGYDAKDHEAFVEAYGFEPFD